MKSGDKHALPISLYFMGVNASNFILYLPCECRKNDNFHFLWSLDTKPAIIMH